MRRANQPSSCAPESACIDARVAEWEKVRAGEIAFVDGNSSYVRFDPKLYKKLFGFEPTDR